MNYKIGEKYLLTTNEWFFAPDGESYRAVFGTLKGIHSDNETLGIKTNARSANWYVEIGNMMIAGCQIFYGIQTDECADGNVAQTNIHNGEAVRSWAPVSIYRADV